MIEAHQQRWQRIQSFDFTPPGAAISFVDKLIAETGWTRYYADAATIEYRRFLLLAAVVKHPVSPSPAVDHVWHVHLLYTRNYWDDLCPNVLGFAFHHEPATGAVDNRQSLQDAYARTLDSYQAIFGHAPPAELWPAQPLFAPLVQVDPLQAIVLPRRLFRVAIAVIVSVFVILFAMLVLTLIRGGSAWT